MSDYEHLTDAELARDVYLDLGAFDDELPDFVTARLPTKKAAALWSRLKGPYCAVEGCGQPHTPSFPWCAAHLAAQLSQARRKEPK